MKTVSINSILSLLFLFLLVGCGNKFEECMQNQQEEYRRQHPKATYADVINLRSIHEADCSSFKK
jgi:hypothetical protein